MGAGTIEVMRRRRWPAVPTPTTGGVRVHGPMVLAAEHGLTVHLVQILAFLAGVELRVALTATGDRARLARHETRPRTDPADVSAQWSFLSVRARVGDIEGDADPYFPRTPVARTGTVPDYCTDPRYRVGMFPITGLLTPDCRMAADRSRLGHRADTTGTEPTSAAGGSHPRPTPLPRRSNRSGGWSDPTSS